MTRLYSQSGTYNPHSTGSGCIYLSIIALHDHGRGMKGKEAVEKATNSIYNLYNDEIVKT